MATAKIEARAAPDVVYSQPTDAQRLRDLLLKAGLSQRGAARELEVDERTMRYWCAGDGKPPRMAILALERLVDLRRGLQGLAT